jgi:Holliday junction resolvasome RuvABC DNA-binding subunit
MEFKVSKFDTMSNRELIGAAIASLRADTVMDAQEPDVIQEVARSLSGMGFRMADVRRAIGAIDRGEDESFGTLLRDALRLLGG